MPCKDEDVKQQDMEWWQAKSNEEIGTDTGATTNSMLDYCKATADAACVHAPRRPAPRTSHRVARR